MLKLEQMVNKMERKYAITSAQNYAKPNKNMLASLKAYQNKNKAELLVLPMAGKSVIEDKLHPKVEELNVVKGNMVINSNLNISNYAIKPQQILPLTGIRRFAQGERCFIFASPKISLEYVPNIKDTFPKAIMTTGALTEPNYRTNTRIGKIAQKDHKYGFVAVDKKDNSMFHFRHVPVLGNGKFADMGWLYQPNKVPVRCKVKAMVVGDLHPYDTSVKHEKATFEQIKYFKPERVFLHDTFNGRSISHHDVGHSISSYKMYEKNELNLQKELKKTYDTIKKYTDAVKDGEVLIVASNHDEWLYRYLDEGRFVHDKGNNYISSKIYTKVLEGGNALEEGLKLVGELPKNLTFLNRTDSYKIAGYELAIHGDMGANGARGSVSTLEGATGKSITGHTHSARIHRDTYQVGTSTELRLDYNKGLSSWTNTNAVLYDIGTVQMINTIKNKWGKPNER